MVAGEQRYDAVDYYTDKRILVTGGRGFLGSNLIGLLNEVDCHIVRVSRSKPDVPGQCAAAVHDVVGDVREREVWERTAGDVDVVFHFAAQTSVYAANEDPMEDLAANVVPMVHLLEHCRQVGAQPAILFAGTVTEAGIPQHLPVDESHPDNPITIYDLHKLMAETYLKAYVRQGTVRGATLRLANVYGPGPRSSSADRGVLNAMIRRALKGEILTVYGKGDCVRDYVHVQDVVYAFLLAGACIDKVNGQHFVIGSGKGHSLADAFNLVADRVARKTGRRVCVVHTDPPESQSAVEMRSFVGDPSRFIQATGWTAQHAFKHGIDLTIEAFA